MMKIATYSLMQVNNHRLLPWTGVLDSTNVSRASIDVPTGSIVLGLSKNKRLGVEVLQSDATQTTSVSFVAVPLGVLFDPTLLAGMNRLGALNGKAGAAYQVFTTGPVFRQASSALPA